MKCKALVFNEKYEKDVEDVCWRYDALGMLANTKRLRNKVMQEWGYSVVKEWGIVESIVTQMRKDRGCPTLWKNFQDLAEETKRHNSKRN